MGLTETIGRGVSTPHPSDTLKFGHMPQRDRRLGRYFFNDPIAKFVLSMQGKIISQNRAAAELLGTGLLSRQPDGCVNFGSQHLNQKAGTIYAKLKQGRAAGLRLLKRRGDDQWVVMNFARMKDTVEPEILLSVIPPRVCSDEDLDALSAAFDLTITETQVARLMVEADCPKDIAATMDISINTVRAHLRAIYSKTGARGYNRALRLILQLIR